MTARTQAHVARVLRHVRRHRRGARNLAWLVLIAVVAGFVASAVAAAPPATPRCGGQFAPGFALLPGTSRSVEPDDATPSQITMNFGASRGERTQPLGLNVAYPEGDTLKGAAVQAWVAEGQLSSNDGNQLSTLSEPVFSGRLRSAHADVCVKFDPHEVQGLRAGAYTGDVRVSVTNGLPFSFPFTVTFRDSRLRAILFASFGVLLGLLVRICSELATRDHAKTASGRQALFEYVWDWNFPTVLILGAISGWLGYVEIYDANPTWGASSFDVLRLFGTCFGFQLGSIGGLELARRLTNGAAPQPAHAGT